MPTPVSADRRSARRRRARHVLTRQRARRRASRAARSRSRWSARAPSSVAIDATAAAGRAGRPRWRAARCPAGPARYGSTTSSITRQRASAPAAASATTRSWRTRDEICRSSVTCERMVSTQSSSTGDSGRAAIDVHAPQVLGGQLDRRQRVLDVVRDLPRHVGPRLEPLRALELAALPLQVGGHLVEVLDQPPQLVRRRRGDARVEIAARDAAASRASGG